MHAATSKPIAEGLFRWPASEPALLGSRCRDCGRATFPAQQSCPACCGSEVSVEDLPRRGTLWSYTENHYAPPAPYPAADPFKPFAVAAVQLDTEGIIVLGKIVEGTGAADLKVGMAMELTTMPLYVGDDGIERSVYAWRIAE